MMIGYSYLHQHNPSIDWRAGEWEFTRCPESCTAPRARKIRHLDAEFDDLQGANELEPVHPWDSSLDDLGDEDLMNPLINWVEIDDDLPEDQTQVHCIASMLEKSIDEDEDEDDLYDEDAVLDPREKARRDKERELKADLSNAADLLGAAALGGVCSGSLTFNLILTSTLT